MALYIFSGIVHPERATFGTDQPVPVDVNQPNAGLKGRVTTFIYKNQIVVTVTSEHPVENVNTLKNVVTDLVSTITNVAGLEYAAAYDVELRSVWDADNNRVEVFGVDVPGLSTLSEEVARSPLGATYEHALTNPLFRRALEDFRSGIRHPADTGFHCYRAMESLVHHFERERGIDKKAAIDVLNATLRLEPACLEFLRGIGGDARHGHVIWISGEARDKALRVTRASLQRFVMYCATGTQDPLSMDLVGL